MPEDEIKDPHFLEFLALKDEYSQNDLESANECTGGDSMLLGEAPGRILRDPSPGGHPNFPHRWPGKGLMLDGREWVCAQSGGETMV
jgi:hypothetical protein